MVIDFNLRETNDVFSFVDNYVKYFSNEQTAYALGYKTPIQFIKPNRGFYNYLFCVYFYLTTSPKATQL
jgi:hypothetical protein